LTDMMKSKKRLPLYSNNIALGKENKRNNEVHAENEQL